MAAGNFKFPSTSQTLLAVGIVLAILYGFNAFSVDVSCTAADVNHLDSDGKADPLHGCTSTADTYKEFTTTNTNTAIPMIISIILVAVVAGFAANIAGLLGQGPMTQRTMFTIIFIAAIAWIVYDIFISKWFGLDSLSGISSALGVKMGFFKP